MRTNKNQVKKLIDKHPNWTATQIAKALKCDAGYVRATVNRNGWTVAKGGWTADPAQYAKRLRDRAAKLLARADEVELNQ